MKRLLVAAVLFFTMTIAMADTASPEAQHIPTGQVLVVMLVLAVILDASVDNNFTPYLSTEYKEESQDVVVGFQYTHKFW